MLEYKTEEWSYRTLPNKTYELVKNTGNMNKQGTGYFTDAESEMLTILEYLNHGVKTNITEAMIEQIDKAIRENVGVTLRNDEAERKYELSSEKFVQTYLELVKSKIAVVYYDGYEYRVVVHKNLDEKETAFRKTLVDCRNYLKANRFCVRIPRCPKDNNELIEVWT